MVVRVYELLIIQVLHLLVEHYSLQYLAEHWQEGYLSVVLGYKCVTFLQNWDNLGMIPHGGKLGL